MKKSLILALAIVCAGFVEIAFFESVSACADVLRVFWGVPLASIITLLAACATNNETLADYALVVVSVVIGAEIGIVMGLMIFESIFGAPIGLLTIAGYTAYAIH